MPYTKTFSPGRVRLLALAVCALISPLAAHAELGGDVRTVQADVQRMNATRQIRQAQSYTVHEIHTSTSAVVREFVSPAGKVFAVSYQGQFLGEGNSLLAGYTQQVGQAVALSRRTHRGGPVSITTANVVYHVTGHMRSYVIHAYLPAGVPQGVQPEELQ